MKVIIRLRKQQIQDKGIEEIFRKKDLYNGNYTSFDETESGVEMLV